MSDAAAFRYVSCKEGGLVTRYGTGTFIGARIENGVAVFEPGEVVAIPLAEWTTYTREYSRVLRAGDLLEKSAKDYEAWLKQQEQRTEKELKERKAAEQKAEAEAKKAAEKAEADKKAGNEPKQAGGPAES